MEEGWTKLTISQLHLKYHYSSYFHANTIPKTKPYPAATKKLISLMSIVRPTSKLKDLGNVITNLFRFFNF